MPPATEHQPQANHEATRWRELTRKADDSLSAKQDEALHYRTQFEAMRLQAGQYRFAHVHVHGASASASACACIGRSQLSATRSKLYNTHDMHMCMHMCMDMCMYHLRGVCAFRSSG